MFQARAPEPAFAPRVGCPPPRRPGRVGFLVLLAFAATAATAQVPVKESVALGGRDDSAQLGELFHRLQVLEQEVRELRGTVEEQAFRLQRLTRQQQEQYIDLDQRLAALRNEAPATAGASRTSPPPPSPGGTAPPERDAYTNAFNLMQGRRFEESTEAFNRLITDYPSGQYTPNAFYWLGELYLAMDEVERARQSFAQVLALYPEHGKVADTLFKLGVVHFRLDDGERAQEYLDRVIAEYPDSPAAGLARAYRPEQE